MLLYAGTMKSKKGCNFEVWSTDDERCKVILFSPFDDSTVDEALLWPSEVHEWLVTRIDY